MNNIKTFTPSFSSTIKFVSKEELKRHESGENIQFPWSAKKTVLGEAAYTYKAGPCQVGGINNRKKMIFFHINPEIFDFNDSKDNFIDLTRKIKSNNNDVQGLITAGMLSKYNNYSIRMFKKIYEILKEVTGANLSIIWGQSQNRSTNASYNVKEDTWYINLENSSLDKDALFSVDDLNKTYSFIHIADGDEVYINGKHIDKSEIKQTSYEEIEAKFTEL